MRLRRSAVFLLLGVLFCLATVPVKAQIITAGPDSVRVPVNNAAADTTKGFFLKTWDKPAKAALFSTIVPGLGQAYNNSYWKVPIIWGTGAVLGYFLVENNRNYQDYREALLLRNSGEEDKYYNNERFPSLAADYQYGDQNLKYRRDTYRRWRDMTILLSLVGWGLNVAEAYVHAHMKEFDIGEDLSLRMQPNFIKDPNTPGGISPVITLTLYKK
ncbi:DUF5683 domain-containing protein [Pontibacter silvestris]|uniref:DUF5683 domain-containing protein n=1 Tax=Pontibacter silvestris TaxID=2305183 RepID=A0ABW4WZ33_9BACT|nr:DUF5683 domain-containing protein [Pontibacter silvestris]MCC9135174.1 DUF5683 domain-containing protein [Pontibacter silvestris]